MVMHVLLGSAADEAGLRGARYTVVQDCEALEEAGDVIVAIDGVTVKTASDLAAYLASSGVRVGDVVTVRVVRGAEVLDVPVRLRGTGANLPDAL